jgi:translation elongation factor P/translation initiation factor 5A
MKIRSGHFLEVVIVDFSSAGRHQENFGRTSAKNAQAGQKCECPL